MILPFHMAMFSIHNSDVLDIDFGHESLSATPIFDGNRSHDDKFGDFNNVSFDMPILDGLAVETEMPPKTPCYDGDIFRSISSRSSPDSSQFDDIHVRSDPFLNPVPSCSFQLDKHGGNVDAYEDSGADAKCGHGKNALTCEKLAKEAGLTNFVVPP